MSICDSCAMKSTPKGYRTALVDTPIPTKIPASVCQDAASINYARRCAYIRDCDDHRLVAYPIERARVEPKRPA